MRDNSPAQVSHISHVSDLHIRPWWNAKPLTGQEEELLGYCNGAIPYTWQRDMLETVFDEVNPIDPPTNDLNVRDAKGMGRIEMGYFVSCAYGGGVDVFNI